MSMKITFRTLKGGTFAVDADPGDTIITLKQKVGAELGVDEYAGYRLIYKGKILADDATVTSAGITSTGFVVVMAPKKVAPKPASKPAETKPVDTAEKAAPSTPSSSKMDISTPGSSPSGDNASKSDAQPESAADANPPAAASSAQPSSSDPLNALVTGAAYESSVKQMCEMGFPEDKVKKALAAAFNNPQRAVDYLFNGIPEMAEPAAPPPTAPATSTAAAGGAPTPTQPTPTAQTGTQTTNQASTRNAPGTPFNMFQAPPSTGTGAAGGQDGGPLDFLRRLPQFTAMRRMIQANPSVLPQLLAQLEEANPSLLALIDANQHEFTRLINEPLPEGTDAGNDEVMEQLAQAMAGAGGPRPGQVVVTEEEHEQILRLSELGATVGLEESDVVETWLACNRDENSAANYLLDHAEELRADKQRNDGNGSNQQNNPESGGDGSPA